MKKNNFFYFLLLLLSLACTPPARNLMEGDAAVQSGDYAKAIEIFLPAAQAGDVEAAYKLGQAYKFLSLSANGGTFQKAAEHWLGLAAEKKHPLAASELAPMLMEKSSAESIKRAVALYELAASKGVTGVAFKLGITYLYGIKDGKDFIINPDIKTAASWFEIAVRDNDLDAMYQLARLLRAGVDIAKDEARAARLIQQAAAKGHSGSQQELAMMYLSGNGVEKNPAEAFALLQKLAEDHPLMALELARCYENGIGTPLNHEEAVKWYETASLAGNLEATFYLSVKVVLGEGGPRNSINAYKLWLIVDGGRETIPEKTSIHQTILEFRDFIAKPFESKSPEPVMTETEAKSFQAQAELGDALAQYKIGLALERGEGVTQDLTKAVFWYEKAAAQGNVDAITVLGSLYRRGKGVTKDYTKALQFFKRAADKGHASAQTKLGVMYDFGYGVERNQKTAAEWYQKAAEQGYVQAQYNLASMLLKGEGVGKDLALAVSWFEKAAAQNELNAILRLAQIYEADVEKSIEWLEKAAEWGSERAIEKLAAIYALGDGVTQDRLLAAKWLLRMSQNQGVDKNNDSKHIQISQQRINEVLKDVSKLYLDVRVVPYFQDGKPIGFKLLSIKSGSIFADAGLRRGDVILSINGTPLTIQNAQDVFSKINTQSTPLTAEIIRQGEKKTLTIEIVP